MEKTSHLAICLLNWNGLPYTTECIASLLASSNQNFSIIVLDNGSTNNEVIPLQKTFGNRITVFRSETNLGFAGGYNHLILDVLKNQVYDYYLLLNQDTIISQNTVQLLLDYITHHPHIAVVGPKVLHSDGSIQSIGADINLWTGKITSRQDNIQQPNPVDMIVGNCFLVRASVIKQLGLFDANYFAYYEEADWCVQVKRANLKCVVVPQATINHRKSGGFRTYLIVRNMIWFEKKFAPWWQLLIFWCYFWLWFWPERLKKHSPLNQLWAASIDGWLGLNQGKARFLK